MPKPRKKRGHMMIRRVRRNPLVATAAEKAAVHDQDADDGGAGFSGRNTTDFLSNTETTDFVTDNELDISDELYAEYAETVDDRSAEAAKPTFGVMAKMYDAVSRL